VVAATCSPGVGQIFFDRDACFSDRLQPLFQVFLQTALQQFANAVRSLVRQLCPLRLSAHHRRQFVGDGFTLKRGLPSQHFEQDAPERPNIGPPIYALPLGLLR